MFIPRLSFWNGHFLSHLFIPNTCPCHPLWAPIATYLPPKLFLDVSGVFWMLWKCRIGTPIAHKKIALNSFNYKGGSTVKRQQISTLWQTTHMSRVSKIWPVTGTLQKHLQRERERESVIYFAGRNMGWNLLLINLVTNVCMVTLDSKNILIKLIETWSIWVLYHYLKNLQTQKTFLYQITQTSF